MASPLRTTADTLRSSAKAAVVRSGHEEQARTLLGRVREARSAFDPVSRRTLRDEHEPDAEQAREPDRHPQPAADQQDREALPEA
ncbi:MAG TPA: hypothetical protein VK506_06735 [Conexibacter sp.]|nr:hypothetical protein [Conexibacter sp.]